jgi:hypothetical protein
VHPRVAAAPVPRKNTKHETKTGSGLWGLIAVVIVVAAIVLAVTRSIDNGKDSTSDSSSSYTSTYVDSDTPLEDTDADNTDDDAIDITNLDDNYDVSYAKNSEWVVGNTFTGSINAKTVLKDIKPVVSNCSKFTDDQGVDAIQCTLTWTNTYSYTIDPASQPTALMLPFIIVTENESEDDYGSVMEYADCKTDPACPFDSTPIKPGATYSRDFAFGVTSSMGMTPKNVYIEMNQSSETGDDFLDTTIAIINMSTLEVNQTKGATAQ